MKFKRLLALGLVFMSAAMVGCGSKGNDTSSADIVTEIKEPVEITFWHAMNGDLEKSLTSLTEKFMAENPNIKVTLQNQSSYKDLQQKITATVASPKDLPTMTQAYPDWMFNPIKDNLVTDLTPYIENETLKFDNYEDILPSFRESAKIDGKIYGMPFNKSTEVLWYNKTLLDELGLKAPTTYDELVQVAKTIKEKKGIAGAGFDSLNTYYTTFLKTEGKTFDSSFDVTSEASAKALNYYLEGVKEGYFRIAGTDNYLSGPFGNGTVAMYVGSNAGENFVKQGVGDKFEVAAAPYPTSASLQQGTDLYVFSSATAEQKTAAYMFLKFLTTKENQITWASETGYMPVRQSAIDSEEYKKSGSLIAPILSDATKNLYTNPVVSGADAAYREAGTVMETVLANPSNADVTKTLEGFKTTLKSIWE
ncbi:MAG: ABC transporter substrate-binding protein [Clostridium sp.]|uniref:ABC transporter substrate-binding protein n=2 Tax=Clostridium sp. TaxID=1506 RepID=UPI0029018789|nr:ABC transporter substrate-binding protein [Clostridium sp.]MDU1124950.1 ABC transporter substrate-binding protein [Clostridium sp.]MDU3676883.1 ABC transporter substrate-binding protein [Clostridium sp.]MDU6874312.1 ABC transporter substrate-binding protein [Clostridium sp.]MDU6935393.1 ABC transporter substrate-binding protein [Clostridium sp.]